MFNIVSQEVIIEKLNRYFNTQNLPLKCNEDGICNGLAHVYAQYILAGEEAKFHQILKIIANDKMDDSIDSIELDKFITHLFLSFIPEQYNKELSQATAIKALGKSVESVFELGMVLNDRDWQSVIKDIDLKEDEVMIINSIDHTIALKKKNGKYMVYDPNYLFGLKPVKNELSLVRELHQHVFGYQSKRLGMRIHIVKNTSLSPESKRDALPYYQHYLSKEKINGVAKIGIKTTNNLLLAIECNDEASISYLLKTGVLVDERTIAKAIIGNHSNIVIQLIENQCVEDTTMNASIIIALEHGRFNVFMALMEHSQFNQRFNTLFLNTNKPLVIQNALKGGNIELFNYVIEKCINNKTQYHDFYTAMNRSENCNHTLMAAIDGGNIDCFKRLIHELNTAHISISEQTKMDCLMYSIKSNQLYVCSTLLSQLPPKDISHLHLRLSMIEKTNVFILKELEHNGVVFSKRAQAIIAQKEQRSIGILLALGVSLEKFIDYLTKKKDITLNKNQFFQSTTSETQEKTIEIKSNLQSCLC